MALMKEEKAKIIKEFAKSANDCGSTEEPRYNLGIIGT